MMERLAWHNSADLAYLVYILYLFPFLSGVRHLKNDFSGVYKRIDQERAAYRPRLGRFSEQQSLGYQRQDQGRNLCQLQP